MSLVQYNALQDNTIQTLWYGGTNVLAEGQALAYDTDDTNAPIADSWDPSVDPGPNSLSPTANRNLRGSRVVDVSTALTGGFAGLVAQQSSGLTGPCFVDVIVPVKGKVARALTKANQTKNSTVLRMDAATPTNNLIAASDATFNIDVVAVSLQTVDTSTTAGIALVRFM